MSIKTNPVRSAAVPQTSGHQHSSAKGYEPGPSLDKVAKGEGLMKGHKGQGVLDAQNLLNAAGANPPLATDGLQGPKTESAIYTFQRQNGLRADGVLGPKTLQALRAGKRFSAVESSSGSLNAPSVADLSGRPAGTQRAGDLARLNPAFRAGRRTGPLPPGRANGTFAGDAAQRENQAEQLLRSNGQWPPQEGRTYAIQIDQDPPPTGSSRADRAGYLRDYTGQTAVFKAEGGRLREVAGPMDSAAHPGQFSTSQSPDVNGDGRSDIATLRAGVYDYSTRTTGSGRLNPTSNHAMQVARDVDGDGAISAAENQFAGQNQMYATGLQWHAGNANRPSSIGCQTMSPRDFSRFTGAVQSGNDSSFTYLLVRRANDKHGENPL